VGSCREREGIPECRAVPVFDPRCGSLRLWCVDGPNTTRFEYVDHRLGAALGRDCPHDGEARSVTFAVIVPNVEAS
jgi:hypothetical protein